MLKIKKMDMDDLNKVVGGVNSSAEDNYYKDYTKGDKECPKCQSKSLKWHEGKYSKIFVCKDCSYDWSE